MSPTTTGFAASESFLRDYVDVITSGFDLAHVATWLFDNAKRMNEAMFFDQSIDWSQLEAVNILAMRACAPDGVFTATAKGGYLTQVSQASHTDYYSDHMSIADIIFLGDFEFISSLPEGFERAKPQLIELMQMAYRYDIRRSNSRVRAL